MLFEWILGFSDLPHRFQDFLALIGAIVVALPRFSSVMAILDLPDGEMMGKNILSMSPLPEELRNDISIALPVTLLLLAWGGWFLLRGGKLGWTLGKGFTVAFAAAMAVLIILSMIHFREPHDLLSLATLSCVFVLTWGLFRLNREITAARASEETCRLLVEGVQDYAIFALDPKGCVVSWNAGAERLKGYRADEIIGEHFSRFFLPEDIKGGVPEEELREAVKAGKISAEGIRIRKDGTQFYASVTVTALRNKAGELRGFSKITRDITARKQAEGAQQAANRKAYADLLESISDGFVAFDHDWRYLRVNSAASRLLRKPAEELLGKVLWEVFPAAQKLVFGEELRRAMNEKAAVRFENYYPEPLNAWFELRCYPSADGLNVFFIDITASRAKEQQLRQLSRVVEQSPVSVIITNLNGDIEYVNPKFTETTGYSFEEAIGQNPRILKSGELPTGAYKDLWNTVLAGGEWHGEFHNRKKNGEYYWEVASICPITDENGVVTHLLAVKEDITARKNAEEALGEAKRSAEQANQAKDVFLATLSHELRTPLTPVLLTASSLEGDETVPEEFRSQFSLIRSNIELESRLIDDLLDITKIAHGKFSVRFQNVDLNDLLSTSLEIVRAEFEEKKIMVGLDAMAHSSVVRADPARLQQVFWNLLKNAIKFTPPGGNISIRTSNPNPQSVAIEIQDTGIGISPEFIDEVFQPFQQGATTGKPQYGGLGLGLSISKSIIEVHGGAITVASDGPKSGTTFTVQLPVSVGEVKTKRERSGSVERVASRHILLVEDHEPTRTVLSRLLQKDGHQVQAVGSCEEALDAAQAQSAAEPFQSLICDLGLPDGSGLDLAPKLKAILPDLVSIALSGFGTDDDMRHSRDAGFAAHLVKPVSIQELRHTLEM